MQQLCVKILQVEHHHTAMILRQTLKTAEIQERHVKIQSNVVKACFTYQGTS